MDPRDTSVRLMFDGCAWPGTDRGAAETHESVCRDGIRLARHVLELITVACANSAEERLTA